MRYFKFLAPHRTGPVTGFRWPAPGMWTASPGEGGARRPGPGMHAATPAQLPLWLHAELWEVELAGTVEVSRDKVAAERGRLVRRVDAWDDATAASFMAAGAWHARDAVHEALVADGLAAEATELRQVPSLAMLADAAPVMAERLPRRWWRAVRLLGQAAAAGAGPSIAAAGYLVALACGAGVAGPGEVEERFYQGVVEARAWQAEWLDDRLDLTGEA